MIQRMVVGGVIAGFAAGLLAALLHFAFIQEILLLGEEYETGALVHFAADGAGGHGSGEQPAATHGAAEQPAAAGHDHGAHDQGDEAEVSTFERNALTVLFTASVYAGYGLFLAAAFQLAETLGRPVTAASGLLWGVAGFFAFQMSPAMGLAPELPGTIAADYDLRFTWWVAAVAATVAGLGILAYGRNLVSAAVAAALLAAPHVVGAPHPDQFWGVAPPELGAEFAARTLGVGLVVWAFMGWLSARLWVAKSA